jgi:hypothetical protein
MSFLDDLLEVKYSVSQWYINNSDFDNLEFAPVIFNLDKQVIDDFAREARGYPNSSEKPSRARRNKDGRLIIKRPFDGIIKRLRKVNETDYMLVGNKLIDKQRIPPEKAIYNFRTFEYEYILDLDIRSDENFNPFLESLSSTESNPQFLECTLKKQNRFTKETISEELKYLIDMTNKYWNSSNNKYDWSSIFYILDSKDELKSIVIDNLDKGSRRRRENYLIDRLMAEEART